MKILNLGCGYPRLKPPFLNLDNLHAMFAPDSPERQHLDKERNYVNHDVLSGPLPFGDGEFDAVLASHFFEHFDAQDGLRIMVECKRIIRNGGALVASVPNASYFRSVYAEDRNENWESLFGVVDKPNPIPTFFEAALWFNEHKAILTEDALWCYFTRAGFTGHGQGPWQDQLGESVRNVIVPVLANNRPKFSLVMAGVKE